MKLKKILLSAGAVAAVGLGAQFAVHASDHDDGSQAQSENNLNLTDLFVFREDNQTGSSADSQNLILIMDSNGHTPAGQQVFFNTSGRYDFHISRVAAADMNTSPTGRDDVIIRFEFGEPDANQHQSVTVTTIKDGQTMAATGTGMTTTLAEGKSDMLAINTMMVGSTEMTVFAGLREDPFFFDVEQFLKVRAGAAGQGPLVNFRPASEAVDGFAHQNVNSIVLRVPIAFLQSAGEPVFDAWETTSIR